jgi:hypothetical protein
MNRFAAKYAVVIALFISLGGEAHAQPREVLVVASTNRCIDAQLLASAIHRDTSLPVRVVTAEVNEEASREGATVRLIVVDVTGQGEELLVELRGTEPELSQPLRATACETASDVAAAFVASVLAPPPPVVVPPAADARDKATELQEKNDAVAERAALMVEDLDSEIRARWIAPPRSSAFFWPHWARREPRWGSTTQPTLVKRAPFYELRGPRRGRSARSRASWFRRSTLPRSRRRRSVSAAAC